MSVRKGLRLSQKDQDFGFLYQVWEVSEGRSLYVLQYLGYSNIFENKG